MSSHKTEQPTPKRLRDARKKGQVARSKEVGSTALLTAIFAIMAATWHGNLESLQEMVLLPARFHGQPFNDAFKAVLGGVVTKSILILLPFLFGVVIVGILANFLQVGPLFVVEPIKPALKKLNPMQKLKQIFSIKNLVELLKTIIKTVFLGVLLYIVIKGAIPALVLIPYSGVPGVLSVLTQVLRQLAVFTILAYVVIAAADFVFQKRQHTKGLMMTKDEVKREYKEMEGDPMIKSKRRHLHQEMAMSDRVERVKRSTVLVTNPTHLAVALYYDQQKTKLPVIYAKGEGFVAKRMVEVAQQEDIPIMQNVPLAHHLFDHGDVNQYIPSELIEPIAEVLRWVRQIRRQSASWGPPSGP